MTLETIWREFLSVVREEVGSRVVETWFNSVTLHRWDALTRHAQIETPNSFIKDWVEKHYRDLCRKHLGRLLNEPELTVAFLDATNDKEGASEPFTKEELNWPQRTRQVVPARRASERVVHTTELTVHKKSARCTGAINPYYMFDTFVVGPSNNLAFSAAQAVAERIGKLYNPLFIYGVSGMGKTHLLHAIGNYVRDTNPAASIVYQSADRFVNEFINAIRFDKVHQFEEKYKDVDLLLVDDIQCISKKEQTQEAFFNIFNSLHQLHKQIVITSDSMPGDIRGLAQRMRSRLEGGLIVDIQLPPLETMMAIVHRKAELYNQQVPADVAHFLASSVVSNIRELEGSLIRLLAFASLTRRDITLELAKQVLLPKQERVLQNNDFKRIVSIIGLQYGQSLNTLRSASRSKEVVFARHIAMYFMKKLTDRSLREIGSFLERSDHTTVIHAYEKIARQRMYDAAFDEELKLVERRICE